MVRKSHFPRRKGWPDGHRRATVSGTRTVPGAEEVTVKKLECRDAGFDCDAVMQGESVDEVMAQAGPHAKEAHGVEVTPEMAGQVRTLVRDA
jgi:predicted small metal-binding protein